MAYNISSFVDDLIPAHISNDYPELIDFIKVYALYLEKENNAGFYLNQLDTQRDIDLIDDKLLESLQREIGVAIPRNPQSDPRLFYKHLIEFYRSRGTPDSIKSFFRLIHDEDVEVYFPKDDILSPSDGRWTDISVEGYTNYSDAIVADPSSYIPVYTWTLTSGTSLIDFVDDNGISPKFNDEIVLVNGVLRTDVTEVISYNSSTVINENHLKFDTALVSGDVVKVYTRGYFTTKDGMPDELKYIQDSYFYQKFSYVLRTGTGVASWKDNFNRLVHPAGFVFLW